MPHLTEDRELKSEHFGVGFIWTGWKLSTLWQKYVLDLFVTLTWPLPKSNRLVLGWWQIIPENFMQFGQVVFDLFMTLTLTFDLIAPKITLTFFGRRTAPISDNPMQKFIIKNCVKCKRRSKFCLWWNGCRLTSYIWQYGLQYQHQTTCSQSQMTVSWHLCGCN